MTPTARATNWVMSVLTALVLGAAIGVLSYIHCQAVRAPFSSKHDGCKSAVPPCKCGCVETGSCKCQNCDTHTADPGFVPAK